MLPHQTCRKTETENGGPSDFFHFLGVDLFVEGVEVFFGITLTTCGDEIGMNRNKNYGKSCGKSPRSNRYFSGNGFFFTNFVNISPLYTLPEANIAPKNGWLEYDPFLLGSRPIFRGELLVSGRVHNTSWPLVGNEGIFIPNIPM